jgi:putative ABC transport system permease protein
MSGERWRRSMRPARPDLRADVDEEFSFHVEMLTRELVAAGWSPPAAAAEAARRFGAVHPVRDECLTIDERRVRRATMEDFMFALLRDLRHVARTLRHTPGFSLIVTLVLALGIGSTTAIFSVLDAVLIRPLSYANPSALVQVTDIQGSNHGLPASFPEYLAWRANATAALSEVAAWDEHGEVLVTSGDAEQLLGAQISANLPAVLGVKPLIGRFFRPDEEIPGGQHVAVLSEAVWRRRFGSDPGIVGRSITLTGVPHVVVGVFPETRRSILPSSYDMTRGHPDDFWEPLALSARTSPRDLHFLDVIGRLRPGLTIDAARQRIAAMAAALRTSGTKHGVEIAPLAPSLLGDLRTPMRLLLAAVGVLLLIACANVANLLLARASTRRHEFAIRTALGASRQRILMLVLVESVTRALIGATAGVAFAYGIIAAAHRMAGSVPRMAEVTIDARVLGATLAVAVACGLLFGCLPAIQASRRDAAAALRDGGRGLAGGGAERLTGMLIIAEISLSFVLLTTAGLLGRSFANLRAVPTGMSADDLMTASTWLPSTRYPDSLSQLAFFDRLRQQLEARFGPRAATLASELPVLSGTTGSVTIGGRADVHDDDIMVEKRIVANNYFDVLRTPIARGRSFQSTDVLGAAPVVVINQAFARKWFTGENPVGKRVGFDWGIGGLQTIVGVVSDLREGPLDQPPEPAIYISAEQRPNSSMAIVVRSIRSEAVVTSTLRDVLHGIDPALPLNNVQPMSALIDGTLHARQAKTIVLGAFAAMALVLVAVGLFGVVSYSVAQRTKEIGIRAALGATRGELLRLVLMRGVRFTGAGIVVGVAGALLSGRLVASQLFAVTRSDPATLGAVAAVLVAVALLACAVPARRAARIDPLDALRGD